MNGLQTCQVFAFLLLIVFLIFITSFVFIDLHAATEAIRKEAGEFDTSSKLFHLHQSRTRVVESGSDPRLSSSSSSSSLQTIVSSGGGGGDESSNSIIAVDNSPQASEVTDVLRGGRDSGGGCSLTFPPTCKMNPLVKYWDEMTECYHSPLRDSSGSGVAVADRKYVVFQADPGGWNNIRMALEVVILYALVTGRILVLPPNAVLYLLATNHKWDDNKSSMEDYFDFEKLKAKGGLEVITMKQFLTDVALPGLLKKPLPNGNTDLAKKELFAYLEEACYVRIWSPGKTFLSFNITGDHTDEMSTDFDKAVDGANSESLATYSNRHIGTYEPTTTGPGSERYNAFLLNRTMVPYDAAFHAERAIYFPGKDTNRLLTHFYSFMYFMNSEADRRTKRFMRDRLRYHDEIFCVGSRIIDKLLMAEKAHGTESKMPVVPPQVRQPRYVAYHIRRGDFQQKHTRWEAQRIVDMTMQLIPDPMERIAYIATDEKNRSFFLPFDRAFKKIYFLNDLQADTGIDKINQNFVGMIEQVVCASADIFIGTPLSTFTAYITRMRGFLNRTITPYVELPATLEGNKLWLSNRNKHIVHSKGSSATSTTTGDAESAVRVPASEGINRGGLYNRTYYFMGGKHMHQLRTHPRIGFPLWIRDFVDVFKEIDDDIDPQWTLNSE